MYKLLLLLPLFLLLEGCAQSVVGITPQKHETPYSLEAIDARYHQGQ